MTKNDSSGSVAPASPRALFAAALALATAGLHCRRTHPAATVVAAASIDWAQNAARYRSQVGQQITVACPPNGTPGTVWGSDLYTDDSSICTAALHSGRVNLATGGTVAIEIAPGSRGYLATTRNGVTTRTFALWGGSFRIVGGAAPGLVAVPVAATPIAPIALPVPPMPTVPGGSAPGADAPSPWAQSATPYRAQQGQTVTLVCPPGGSLGSVWGTDVYTDDSSICSAAVHAGRFTTASGGTAVIFIRAGLPAYMGSERNGVTSQNYDAFPGSFAFDPNAVAVGAPPGSRMITWSASATEFRAQTNQAQSLFCPPNGAAGSVWGTGIYTDDSSVCTAAVHAGIITMAAGGRITVTPTAGMPAYTGSAANGVTSQDYATYPGSFTVAH